MEGEAECQKERDPRRVKEGQNTLAGHELANLIDVPKRHMRASTRIGRLLLYHSVEDWMCENLVKL